MSVALKVIECSIQQYAVQPGVDPAITVETLSVEPGLDQTVLHQVFSSSGDAHQFQCKTHEP